MDSSQLYTGSASRLALLFHDQLEAVGGFLSIQPEDLPPNAQTLLAHTNHMTVTLESFYGCNVNVDVVAVANEDSAYSREILLRRESDDAVVQYGIMRIWLDGLPAEVARSVEAEKAPLGHVLIENNLLRDVELMSFWEIAPSDRLRELMSLADNENIYGRTAQILVDERPTVQLLEIVRI